MLKGFHITNELYNSIFTYCVKNHVTHSALFRKLIHNRFRYNFRSISTIISDSKTNKMANSQQLFLNLNQKDIALLMKIKINTHTSYSEIVRTIFDNFFSRIEHLDNS